MATIGPDRTARQQPSLMTSVAWARDATFTVVRCAPTKADLGLHELLLRAGARAVTSLGGSTRRGLGSVTITDSHSWTTRDTEQLRSQATGPRRTSEENQED